MDIEEMGKEVGKKVTDIAQSAVEKGKELTEAAKILLSIKSAKDKIKAAQQRLGQYVADNRLLGSDETVSSLYEELDGYANEIAAGENRLRELKNQAVCTQCGAVVPAQQIFCDKCGASIPKPAPAQPEEEPEEAPADKMPWE
ncbi:MAG: hypothetical protein Q4G07_02705 [Oscillospiraceae bacterium]|nr:hypothetical protein [Oscillospiraceae bacterium]